MPEVAFLDQLIGEKLPQNIPRPASGGGSSQGPAAGAFESNGFGKLAERPADPTVPDATDKSDALEMSELLDIVTLAD